MNRSFPGNPEGSITEKIADYFQRTLLPLAEWVLDLHSGGKTLDFLPFCAAHRLEDKQQEQRCAEAMRAFNAPYSMMLLEIDSVGIYDTAAEAMGKVFITTELGGKGTATRSWTTRSSSTKYRTFERRYTTRFFFINRHVAGCSSRLLPLSPKSVIAFAPNYAFL